MSEARMQPAQVSTQPEQAGLSARDREAMDSKSPEVPRLLMDRTKLMMLCFLGSEVVFFGLLIIAYIYYQVKGIQGPNAKEILNVPRTFVFSLFLFASSGTIFIAERFLARKNHRMFITWMWITVLFGAIFIAGQVWEYTELLSDNITMTRNLFGTTFFTVTGFHGLHVTAGLIVLSIFTVLGMLGDFRRGHSSALTAASWYWHFVDVVWVVIFSLIYLIPFFSQS